MSDSAFSRKNFNHFEVTQVFKQQLYIKAPCIHNHTERSRILEMILCKRDSITSAIASPQVGSVNIQFNPETIALDQLFILLDKVLDNISSKIGKRGEQDKYCFTNSSKSTLISSYIVKGLKCEACAISLEMAINRHPEINSAEVNFKTSLLKIDGELSKQEINNLVLENGFESNIQSTCLTG